jgi:hypothetical protein
MQAAVYWTVAKLKIFEKYSTWSQQKRKQRSTHETDYIMTGDESQNNSVQNASWMTIQETAR